MVEPSFVDLSLLAGDAERGCCALPAAKRARRSLSVLGSPGASLGAACNRGLGAAEGALLAFPHVLWAGRAELFGMAMAVLLAEDAKEGGFWLVETANVGATLSDSVATRLGLGCPAG